MALTTVETIDQAQLRPVEATRPDETDFDLHGVVGVRLLNAGEEARVRVANLLGPPLEVRLGRDPDVIIRWVDDRFSRSTWRYAGPDAAYDDAHLFVLSRRGRGQSAIRLPWDCIGGRCEITCEPDVRSVSFLLPIINLTMLQKGVLPVHGSAFRYEGRGILVVGWTKGGKTETLLAFMAHGAEYVGDEWVFVSGDGQRLFGLPLPIRVWDWHLRSMPRYRSRLPRSAQRRLAWTRHAERAVNRLLDQSAGSRCGGVLSEFQSRLARKLGADVHPDVLFGRGRRVRSATFQHLIFAVTREDPAVETAPMHGRRVAAAMAFSLRAERASLTRAYLAFRFAFPDRANRLLEQADALERDLLDQAFAGKKAHLVYHPSPMCLEDLFGAVTPLILGD